MVISSAIVRGVALGQSHEVFQRIFPAIDAPTGSFMKGHHAAPDFKMRGF